MNQHYSKHNDAHYWDKSFTRLVMIIALLNRTSILDSMYLSTLIHIMWKHDDPLKLAFRYNTHSEEVILA